MHYVRESFDKHQVGDFDRAVFRHAAQIVAPQVYEHHMLGALLLVLKQRPGQSLVLGFVRAAPVGPGDRAVLQPPPRAPHQHLGRSAEQRFIIAQLEEKHVRRRVDHTQRAVDLKRAGCDFGLEPLREDDLKGVARANVLFDRRDRMEVALLAHVRGDLQRLRTTRRRRGFDGGGQRSLQPGDLAACRDVFFAQPGAVLFAAGEDVGDYLNLVLDMIEREQAGEEHDHRRIHIQIVFRLMWEPLEPAHGVVAEITDRAARERGQPRRADRLVFTHQIAHYVQHRGDDLLARDGGALDRDLGLIAKIAGDVARPNYGVRRAAEERIPRDLLAALYRFEQEGTRTLARAAPVSLR